VTHQTIAARIAISIVVLALPPGALRQFWRSDARRANPVLRAPLQFPG
jgi:hypothetical protein